MTLTTYTNLPGTTGLLTPPLSAASPASSDDLHLEKPSGRRRKLRSVLMRAGTSKGLFFRREDLPENQDEWGPLILAAMGSPDTNGRQLDGMGGGTSTQSKVAVVSASSLPDADVDYLFIQGEPSTGSSLNGGRS